jgi:hypothetical protein
MKCDFLQLAVCTNVEAPTNGQHVAPMTCRGCEHYKGQARGLGDRVHTVLSATGVHQVVRTVVGKCGGCAQRRQALNEKFPSSANAGIDETPKKQ